MQALRCFSGLLLLAAPGLGQGSPVLVSTGTPFYVPFNDLVVSDSAGGPSVVLNGNFALDLPKIDVCFFSPNVSSPGCSSGSSLDYTLGGGFAVDLSADESGSVQKRLPLATVPVFVYTFPGLPNLTGTIYLEGSLFLSGEVEAGMRLGMVGQFEVDGGAAGFRIGSSSPTAPPKNTVFEFSLPELTGDDPLEFTLAFEGALTLEIAFQGVPISRPSFRTRLGIQLKVDPLGDPWWSADGFLLPLVSFGLGPLGGATEIYSAQGSRWSIADAGGPLVAGTPGAIRWSRTYDQASDEDLTGITASGDELIAIGNGAGPGNRAWLAGLGNDGVPVWEKRAQQAVHASFRPFDAHLTPRGELAVGSAVGIGVGARLDLFDTSGVERWSRAYADANGGILEASGSITTADGGFALCGRVRRSPLTHPILIRLDADGDVLWAKEYELDLAAGATNGSGVDLAETSTGNFVIAGEVLYEDNPGPGGTIRSNNALVMSLTSNGDLDWAVMLGGIGYDYATAVTEVDGGDLVFVGKVAFEDHSNWIARLASDGTLLWSRVVAAEHTSGNDLARGVTAAPGGVVACGTSDIGASTDSWLCKIDHNGDVVWFKSMIGPDLDELVGVERLATGLVAWGMTRSIQPIGTGGAEDDLWIVRTGFDGMLHYDLPSGFDAFNDLRGQSPTFDVVSFAAPGQIQDMSIVDDASVQLFLLTNALVTLLTQ